MQDMLLPRQMQLFTTSSVPKQDCLWSSLFFSAYSFFSFLSYNQKWKAWFKMQSGCRGNNFEHYLMVSAALLVHQEQCEISWVFKDSVTWCDTLYITVLEDEEWFQACQNKPNEFTEISFAGVHRKGLMRKRWEHLQFWTNLDFLSSFEAILNGKGKVEGKKEKKQNR